MLFVVLLNPAMSCSLSLAEIDVYVKYQLLRVGYAPHEMLSVTKALLRQRKLDVLLMFHSHTNHHYVQDSSGYFEDFMGTIDWLLHHSQVPEESPMFANVSFGHVHPLFSQGSSTSVAVAGVDVNGISGQTQLTRWACGCGFTGCTVDVDIERDVEYAAKHKGIRHQFRMDACVISCKKSGCQHCIFTRHTYCRPRGWHMSPNHTFHCPSCR